MEDIVKQAMAKWPNVPDCYGWLGLDARGDWYLRDAEAQACGSFASGPAAAKGVRLQHAALLAFIARNYDVDAQGRWFFQNGPQRVFVELAVAPWIWRLQTDGAVRSHTGLPADVQSIFCDETGRVFLATDLGLGLVHTQDVVLVADWLDSGRWTAAEVAAQALPQRFGYILSPQLLQRDAPR